MKKLSKDELLLVGLNLDFQSIKSFLKSYRKFYQKTDENFWKLKMEKDYPFLIETKKGTWRELYFEANYWIEKIEKEYAIPYINVKGYNPKTSYLYGGYNYILNYSALGNFLEIVKLATEKGANSFEIAIENASEKGHMEIVKFLIDKTQYYDVPMTYAAREGYLDIVKLFIEKGAENLEWTMSSAAYYGHLDIVKYLIEKGAKNYDWGLRRAAEGGHIDIVKYLILLYPLSNRSKLYYMRKIENKEIRNLLDSYNIEY